jgi:ATP-dependent Lon protease
MSIDNLKVIVYLQRRFRIKKIAFKSLNNDINYLNKIILTIINNVNNSYNTTIITQELYNTHIETVESIYFKLTKLPQKISFKTPISIRDLRKNIDIIIKDIKNIVEDTGCNTLFDTIDIAFFKKKFKKSDFLIFINSIFRPFNYKIYTTNNEVSSKELVVHKNKQLTNLETYDYKVISNLETYAFQDILNSNTILLNTQGSRLYVKICDNYLVCDGIFIDDTLNIYRKHPILKQKLCKLKKAFNDININKNFKLGFFEQLSLRDFIIYDIHTIITLCHKSYNKVKKLKNNTISSLIKEFLSSNTIEQRNILTLFLLLKDDIDTQYLAHLMYDMISNESYLLKPQPLSEQIYSSLHWSIKKIFTIAITNVDKYNKKLLQFNENDISYEKRIALLKVNDYVKSKAMEKYKEILNKGGENASKAQQYLDGLLKIPFGIFKEENIISFLNDFKKELYIFFKETQTLFKTDFLDNDSCNIKCRDINTYNNLFNTQIETLLNNSMNNDIDIIFKKHKKIKMSKLKEIATSINDLFGTDVINIYDKKQLLYSNLFQFIKSYNHDYKLKYCMITKIKPDYDNSLLVDNSITSFYKLEQKWCDYKKNTVNYLNDVKKILDDAIFSQAEAKKEIQRIIAQWINGESRGYCFGFEGPPGIGKTSLAKKGISKCLINDKGESRPFSFIALGGSSNGSILEGHSYTYVGSTWGKIVDILMETKCMNPIIYIDELDKISNTENGKEIIGILTHMTDSSQNDEFYDKYFSGVKIDLSKVLFIFSYNNFSLLDPILADRIHRVQFKSLSKKEKIYIINNYILPELLETVGFPVNSVTFSDDVLLFLMYNYTFEAGIRKLKQKIFEIVRELNLRYLMNQNDIELPIEVTKELVEEIFSNKLKIIFKKISLKPHVGLVNGLYATNRGTGGITIIEAFKTPSDTKLSLILTGQQGDVMKESMRCSKTIAWNIIPDSLKKKIYKEWKDSGNWGIHIHCPEAATPKDGPSAGGAITLAIISLLTGIPVNNKIALTGEIDLNGSVHVIGGLDNKIEGGKMAGVETILYPEQNEQDISIIKKNMPELLNNITIKPVKNIWEILDICLMKNNIEFTRYV